MPIDPFAVAGRVRAIRERRGWSQRQLDQRAGLAHGYTNKLEAGQIPNFSMSQMQKIADALGLELEDLLLGEERASEVRTSAEVQAIGADLLTLQELDPEAIRSLAQIVLAMKEKAQRDVEVRRARNANSAGTDKDNQPDTQA